MTLCVEILILYKGHVLKIINRKQLKIFLILSLLVTLPFGLLVSLEQIKNENGLIMIFPMLAGLPWVLIYMILPFDIPGFTSAATPTSSGGIVLSFGALLLFMVPVYINIYLVTFLIWREKKISNKNKLTKT